MESFIANIFFRYLFDIGIIDGQTISDLITIYTNIKLKEFKTKMTLSLVYFINSLNNEQKDSLSTNIITKFFFTHHKKKEKKLKSILKLHLFKQNAITNIQLIKCFYKWNHNINLQYKYDKLMLSKRNENTNSKHINFSLKTVKKLNKVNLTPRINLNIPNKYMNISPSIKRNDQEDKNKINHILNSLNYDNHSTKYKSRSFGNQPEKSWDKKERESLEECTFSPSINSSKNRSDNSKSVYERLYNTKQKYDNKKELKALELEHLLSKENTFKPELFTNSPLNRQCSLSSSGRNRYRGNIYTNGSPKKTLSHSTSGNVLEIFNRNVLMLKSDLVSKKSKSFIDNPTIDYQTLEKVYFEYKTKMKKKVQKNQKYSKYEKSQITKKIIQKLYGTNKKFDSNDLIISRNLNSCLTSHSKKKFGYNWNFKNEPREQLYIEDFYLKYNK